MGNRDLCLLAMAFLSVAPCGAVVAVGLRNNALLPLVILCLLPAMWFLLATRTWWELSLGQFLFALGFYSTAFQGLLGPLDGAFGGMWMLLSLVYAAFQTAAVVLFSTLTGSMNSTCLWILPCAAVAWEYIRNWVTKLYDGCGLTFCLLGQSLASEPQLLQCVELGGVWLATFVVVAVASALVAWLRGEVAWRHRLTLSLAAILLVSGLWFFGRARLVQQAPQTSNRIETKYVVSYAEEPGSNLGQSLPSLVGPLERQNPRHEICVLLPETWLTWRTNQACHEGVADQVALLDFTQTHRCTLIVGAWVARDSGKEHRNAAVIIQNGSLVAIVDKKHPAPFVEGRPWGTEWLIESGLIPQAATRDVTPAEQPDLTPWETGSLSFIPSVCYDLFFSDTYTRFPQSVASVAVCSLDESQDGNGVFQSLSRVHSRLRAVELRQPIVRSSLGGFNGAFDEFGNAIEPMVQVDGAAVYEVRPVHIQTLYERYGNWFPKLCCVITLTVPLLAHVYQRCRSDQL